MTLLIQIAPRSTLFHSLFDEQRKNRNLVTADNITTLYYGQQCRKQNI
jgi:hypothetical protein